MASRQEKEERAEVAARQAAADLRDVNKGREYEELGAKQEEDAHRPGVIGSVLKKVTDTYEHAKEAVVGKSHEAGETAREYKDYTADKAKETTDSAAGKMEEATESAKEKMREYKDSTVDKAVGTKDSVKDYTKEKAENAKNKAGEYKDYAADKAKAAKDSVKGKAEEYKDYTKEKAEEVKNKAGEYKDYTTDKATAAKDSVKGKAEDYKDYTKEKSEKARNKAGEYKDYTAEKAMEGKDYTAEKAQEGKESTVSKLGELRDSAKDAARRAMDFWSGKKEEAKETAAETRDLAQGNLGVDDDELARRRIEELNLESKEMGDEARRKHREARDMEGVRGGAARGTVFDSLGLGSIKDSIRGKFTQPGDVVGETRAAREHGGAGNKDPENTGPGYAASTLKASDQMTGQTFNDVGRMDDEGVARPRD